MKTLISILVLLLLSVPGHVAAQEPVMGKMYNFLNPDTLEFSNTNAYHLAAVYDGSDIVVLDGFFEESKTADTKDQGGFQLVRLRKGTNGKLSAVAKSEQVAFFTQYGIAMSSFEKTESGFLACNPEGMVLFDKEFNVVNKVYLKKFIFLGATHLKGTTEIAALFYNTNDQTTGLNIWNYVTKKFVHPDLVVISHCDEINWMTLSSKSTGIRQLPNGNLLLTQNLGHSTRDQEFAHIDLEVFRNNPEEDFFLWYLGYKNRLANLVIRPDGKMDILVQTDIADNDEDYALSKVTANAQAIDIPSFNGSISDFGTRAPADCYRYMAYAQTLPDGRTIGIGNGKRMFNFHEELSIVLYDGQMKPVRQYRLPTPMITPFANSGIEASIGSRNYMSCSFNPSKGQFPTFENAYVSSPLDILHNPEDFYHVHNGAYAIWSLLPGASKDELILMSRNAFIKVNLTKYEPYKLPYTPAGIPTASANTSPTNNSTPGSGTVAGTNSGSGSNKPAAPASPTAITVINDLPADIQPKGYIKLNYDGASTHSVYRGKEFKVECSKAKKVYKGSDSGTAKGDLLFEVDDNCGKTIKLSSVW